MKTETSKQIWNITHHYKKAKRWQKIVALLAALAVFATVYALILPAITLSPDTYCGYEEHTHGEECYQTVTTCTQPLTEKHEHDDSCYEYVDSLTCGLEEVQATDESEGHVHTPSCYTQERVLICDKTEDVIHEHTSECYERELICTKEEHKHTDACYSNGNADIESRAEWEVSLPDSEMLTGNWNEDVLTIADSQLGYAESTLNFAIVDGEKKGYTRYGEWYGDPYGDWCAMFVSFCMHYAGVDNQLIPLEASCQNWMNLLDGEKYNLFRDPDEYTPVPGDLIFFDSQWDDQADHIGLVYELIYDEEGNITQIKTIEGNASNVVQYKTYGYRDSTICGYGALPQNPVYLEKNNPDSKTPIVKSVEGSTYTVSVTYTADAGIPDEAVLLAEEYAKNSETYQTRYREAAQLYGWPKNSDYAEWFRLFNIGFYVDGVEIEPAAEVNLSITYKNMAEDRDVECQVTHFGEETKSIEAETETQDGSKVIDFVSDSFSDYGIMAMYVNIDDPNLPATPSGNLLADFTFDGASLADSTGKAKATATGNPTYGWVTKAPGAAEDGQHSLELNGSSQYLSITKKDGSSLLSGYNQITVEFWMYPTKTSTNWPFYAAPNSNTQTPDSEKYIGVLQNMTGIQAERYNSNGHARPSSNAVGVDRTNQWTYVRVDYMSDRTILTVCDETGKVLGSHTVNSNVDLSTMLGSQSILQVGKANWGSGEFFKGYIDELKIYGSSVNNTDGTYHPKTSKTYNIPINGVSLYNVNTADGHAAPLAGVTYTVYDSGKNKVKSYTTGNDYVLKMDDLPSGTYTVKQTGVPSGYIVVDQEKEFTVDNNRDNLTQAGIFFVYAIRGGYESDKTAQVYNYENRIYELMLSAMSGKLVTNIEDKNFNFIVDQSNSMLFPANLTDTGTTIELHYINDNNSGTGYDASGNSARMDAALAEAGLPDNQLYYIIGLEDTKATVFALWKSSNGRWYYQDAAAYAQAQAGKGEYQFADVGHTGDTTIVSSGGCLNGTKRTNKPYSLYLDLGTDFTTNRAQDANNGVNGDKYIRYKIYTGSEYNRLTYLKHAISQMVYQLAAMDSKNMVTITTFDANLETCISRPVNTSNPQGASDLIKHISNILTSGGTAQEKGLLHALGREQGNTDHSDSHLTGVNDIVIMITDGALNGGGNIDEESAVLKSAARDIRNQGATLITVGLSVQNVTLAQTLLADSNHGGIATPGFSFLDIDADKLSETLSNALLTGLAGIEKQSQKAEIKDYISDSFYLVRPDGQALAEGDWINLSGKQVASSAADKAGQVGHDDKGWYVVWSNQTLPANEAGNQPWRGIVYVKAKEDFIGGNTIDTNKTASIKYMEDVSGGGSAQVGHSSLATPTVNVHLLPLNQVNSVETIFLGDRITTSEKIKALKDQLKFTKLISNGDNVHNKTNASNTPGLDEASFDLEYATGNLTSAQWESLLAGETVEIPYIYDDASSHGPVGIFRICLTSTGDGSSFANHNSTVSGMEAEEYTLQVTYTAGRIKNRRPVNVHNGTNGPGTEVGAAGTTTLNNGYGVINSSNVHVVNIVDGKLTVTKEIESSLVNNDQDQTFVFYVMKETAPNEFEPLLNQEEGQVTIEVVVPKGQTTATASMSGLPRGNYQLVEAQSDAYIMEAMTIQSDSTNCDSKDLGSQTVSFDIGKDTNGVDVIASNTGDGYLPVYSYLRDGFTGEDSYKGVSRGAANVKNKKPEKSIEIPVEKHWKQVSTSEYEDLSVYVVLCKDGASVLNDEGLAQVLELNKENSWKGSFEVLLSDAEADTPVEELGYSIQELSGATTEEQEGYFSAQVVNHNPPSLIHYEYATASGSVHVSSKNYHASFEEIYISNDDGDDVYTLVITNSTAYVLPESGGPGTRLYTIGGLLILCTSVLLGVCMRVKRERRV